MWLVLDFCLLFNVGRSMFDVGRSFFKTPPYGLNVTFVGDGALPPALLGKADLHRLTFRLRRLQFKKGRFFKLEPGGDEV